ncbi:AcrB/AcrD/AcrF family protein [Corallincola holothuriorum]|uniref:AcrB/AcrD/AcrF family protein n=1 Tax=Corallincola holothuriorum TaxID=2282215 RepID=A0A368NRA8_9GAMM|nr:efflux RND transporter permease subunit [Corallincola holothuriorum]RCU52453.1 AcrB/AcrD/AcrF family protein [Corallincola holothuriorum]
MNIAQYTITKRTSVWVLMLMTLLGGYLSYQNLGRFEDPEFVIRQAVIVTHYDGATAQEVADEVTDLIEGAVQSLQELKEVESVSRPGVSQVTVEMDMAFAKSDADLQQIWDKLRRKVSDVQNQLPPGAGPSIVNDDFGDVYAQFYAITGEGFSDKQLQDYVDNIRRELALVPGVARTTTLAEKQEAIFVEFARERLAQSGISMEQIFDVLAQQNRVTVAGTITTENMRVPVIPASNFQSTDELKNLHLTIGSDNTVIRLGDIANVTRGYQEPFNQLMRYNGERAIGLGISNMAGGNVVTMGDAVKARLAELEDQRPLGIELHEVSLQSDSVRDSVADFVINLMMAVVIVFCVLLIFMGARSGVIIGFVLLLTVAGTLCIMLFDGIAMQRISLGALIIALGMLVDNAIVITDGIQVRLRENPNLDRKQAVKEVVSATQWPLLGGTLVGILAFSAIGLSPSNMGEYAGSLFWVILYSMILSWLFAITITPMLCHDFLEANDKSKSSQGDESKSVEDKPSALMNRYKALLEWVLQHRKLTLAVILGVLFTAVYALRFVPPGFMPESQRPQFVVDVYLPQGSDIHRTEKVMAAMEQDVLAKAGVTNVTGFIGGGGLRFMLTYSPVSANPSYGQLLVDVDDFHRISPLLAELQGELNASYQDASVMVWKFVLGPGGGKKIEAGFRGPDSQVLRQLAEQAKAKMIANPNLIAVQDDWRQQVPVLQPVYAPDQLQRFGLTSHDVNQAIAQTLTGRNVGVYREGNDLIPIIARSPEHERDRQQAIENTQVFSVKTGRFIQVSQLIESLDVVWQDDVLKRFERVPTIMAQADPAPGILTAEAFASIRDEIEAMPLPPGYSLDWFGEYKDAKEADEAIAISAPYGFAAMVLIVVLMFNGVRQALVIWLTVPLAVIGVAVGLILFQTPFEFMATLGFLSLVGMMVKNAIVLVDQADQDIQAGIEPYLAVIKAATSRARPVALGACTTILGVAPLLADPFFKSMAVTIMFGLLFATVLTLVVIPLFYSMIFRVKIPA